MAQVAGDKASGKVQTKNYVVLKEHIWELQRTFGGNKSSLRKTYKNKSEANDKVWQLNENTQKALALLAKFYSSQQRSL